MGIIKGVTEGVLEEPAPGWYPLPPPPQPLVAAPAIQVQPHAAPIAGPSGQQRAQDEDVDMNGNQEDAEGSQEDEEEEDEGDGYEGENEEDVPDEAFDEAIFAAGEMKNVDYL